MGLLFVFAAAAYWVFERDDAVRFVTSLLPQRHRKLVRDTWDLIDLKLGAYVRGQALLITLVATVFSICFWAIGLPFWLLIAIFAGLVEIVHVIGPLIAGALAVGVGLTVSLGVGIAAGVAVPGDPAGSGRRHAFRRHRAEQEPGGGGCSDRPLPRPGHRISLAA